MAELPERRSTRTRKPVTYFNDQIVQSAKPSDVPISPSIAKSKPLKALAKDPVKALTKELAEVPATKAPAKAPKALKSTATLLLSN